MFRYLTEQGDNKDIRNYCRPECKIYSKVSTILFIIWLFSSLILSKSLMGILLNSFFNIKYAPIVKTIEDIRCNKDIKLWGYYRHLSKASKENKLNINDILERIENNTEV